MVNLEFEEHQVVKSDTENRCFSMAHNFPYLLYRFCSRAVSNIRHAGELSTAIYAQQPQS